MHPIQKRQNYTFFKCSLIILKDKPQVGSQRSKLAEEEAPDMMHILHEEDQVLTPEVAYGPPITVGMTPEHHDKSCP